MIIRCFLNWFRDLLNLKSQGPIPHLTSDVVNRAIREIHNTYTNLLRELLQLASADPSIGRLELDLHPSDAAHYFPVRAWAWTDKREDPRSEISEVILNFFELKHNKPLLSSEFKAIPLGRCDIGGFDFMPETDMIRDALIAETQTIWTQLQMVCRPTLEVYIAINLSLQENDDVEINFLNLRSGRWEDFRPRAK